MVLADEASPQLMPAIWQVVAAAPDWMEENLTPIGRLYHARSTWPCCPMRSLMRERMLWARRSATCLAQVCRKAGITRIHKATQTPFHLNLKARR